MLYDDDIIRQVLDYLRNHPSANLLDIKNTFKLTDNYARDLMHRIMLESNIHG